MGKRRSGINHQRVLAAIRQSLAGARVRDTGTVERREPVDPNRGWQALTKKWHRQLGKLQDKLGYELTHSDFEEFSRQQTRLANVYTDGTIIANCETSTGAYQAYVRLGHEPVVFGCNCLVSMGQHRCPHLLALLQWCDESFEYFYSPLMGKIRDGRWGGDAPPEKLLRFDPKSCVDNALKGLVPGDVVEAPEDTELQVSKQTDATRIGWDIQIDDGYLDVTPVLQKAKKRGGGWTKGRKVSLSSLRDHHESFSEVDQAISNLVTMSSRYSSYRPEFDLDLPRVLKLLVGDPRVMFQGEPADLREFSLRLAFREDARSCWLTFATGPEQASLVVLEGACVRASVAEGLVELSDVTETQAACIRRVATLPKFPLEFRAQLLAKARELSRLIAVELPPAESGRVMDDPTTPVLLVRSHAGGALDYGFRVRDSNGKLHRPGAGMLLTEGTHDGETVQFRRCALTERKQMAATAAKLGLPSLEADGTLKNIEKTLALIGLLQEDEDQSVEVLWDKASEEPLRVLGTITAGNVRVGISTRNDWFQLNGECSLGDNTIALNDLLLAAGSTDENAVRGDYIRIGKQGWAKISKKLRSQFSKLNDAMHQERGKLKFDATSVPAVRDLLDHDFQVKATKAWRESVERIERSEKIEPVLPEGLNAELRDYQHAGFAWLRRLAEWGVGGVLADDMGLGKTLQTLAVMLDRSSLGPALVIAPTSVGFNWIRETEKFAPQLDVTLYRETDRTDFLTQVGPGSVVVCSYGLAMRDASQLAGVQWSTLVLDEAQAIKNSRSKTSTAIATIPADWKVALTGTPVENHLGELWSLLRVVSPGLLGGWEQFRKRYATPIEKNQDEGRRLALRDRLKPFMLRRTKGEVLTDLPARTEMNIDIELTPQERAVYDQVRMSAIGEMDEIANLGDVKDQRFRILAILTRLRQLACSPKLVQEGWTERSSKLNQLLETLLELKQEGHRVLIFSQFVKHLTLIREMLTEESISFEYLDGSTPAAERQKRVDDFQNGEATAFLISLKAGGTGLNLTAADYVIHMDPWWNPAVEDQATDRAHRIGQDKPVMVYRMIANNTIEQEILKLHDTKRDLVAGIMEGAQAAAKLSTDDLIAMVKGSSS